MAVRCGAGTEGRVQLPPTPRPLQSDAFPVLVRVLQPAALHPGMVLRVHRHAPVGISGDCPCVRTGIALTHFIPPR